MSIDGTRNRLRSVTTLVGGARRGDYTMPDELLSAYAAFERLADAPEPAHFASLPTLGQAAQEMTAAALDGAALPFASSSQVDYRHDQQARDDWRRARDTAAEELANRALRAIGRRDKLILGHLQPSLAALLDDFRADVATLGRYASLDTPNVALLGEPDPIRAAYVRFVNIHPPYASIRAAWQILRDAPASRTTSPDTADPQRTASILGEVADAYLIPGWWSATNNRGGWPWGGNSSTTGPVKLGWLVANGYTVWCPTGREQDAAYQAARESGTMTQLGTTTINRTSGLAHV